MTARQPQDDTAAIVVGDVEVGEHVLHVVAVLERVDEAEDLAGAPASSSTVTEGTNDGLRRLVVEPGLLEALRTAPGRRPRR
jgi:hypothetical protein